MAKPEAQKEKTRRYLSTRVFADISNSIVSFQISQTSPARPSETVIAMEYQ
jgi:hypothetical protein